MIEPPKFNAWDKRNRQIYPVVSISWTYGEILREFYKEVPEGDWLPEEVVVILNNGKCRTFNYHPNGKTYMKLPNGSRSVYSYAQRNLHDLTLLPYSGVKKHDQDVYLGDIVQDSEGNCAAVTFEEGEFIAMYADPKSVDVHWNILAFDCDVVGSIYTSPELIKQAV